MRLENKTIIVTGGTSGIGAAIARAIVREGGTVAIGVLPVAALGVLPGALIRVKQRHPTIQVRLQQGRTEELLPLLAAREVEMVVGRLYPPAIQDGFLREALWEEPISFLARSGHPLFAGPVTRAALAGKRVDEIVTR
jgi:LysR family pca operon transcriptional activator